MYVTRYICGSDGETRLYDNSLQALDEIRDGGAIVNSTDKEGSDLLGSAIREVQDLSLVPSVLM